MQSLKINSTLQGGKYKIIATLGQGGFGITYLAENTMLDGKVAIKEFFPSSMVTRDTAQGTGVQFFTAYSQEQYTAGRERFLREARSPCWLSWHWPETAVPPGCWPPD